MSTSDKNRPRQKLNNVQLKQKVIYLQAELSRYKEVVLNYQNNYHYSQLESLNKELQLLKEKLIEKEEKIEELIAGKKDIEEHVKQFTLEKSQLNESYTQIEGQKSQLEKDNMQLKEEKKVLMSENESLRETIKKLEKRFVIGQEKSVFNPKNTSITKDADSESWFLRTLKQQNKKDDQ